MSQPQQEASSNEAMKLADNPQLVEALEEYRAQLEEGKKPDRRKWLERYPDVVESLSECLSGLELIHALGLSLSGSDVDSERASSSAEKHLNAREPLGDFQILRELGRGGMGVVYEAEQSSLNRRVALKVLPFAATMDSRQLQRFKNEAMAAASLDHSHIVDVYGVGCERSVHYYAMRLIEGQTLAEVVVELRLRDQEKEPMPDSISAQEAGLSEKQQQDDTKRDLQAALGTKTSTFSPAYFRSIAELTMHVAEALDYAHERGIIHRDIKPSNLLLDDNGKIWVTDFGLAHVESSATLTMTGNWLARSATCRPNRRWASEPWSIIVPTSIRSARRCMSCSRCNQCFRVTVEKSCYVNFQARKQRRRAN